MAESARSSRASARPYAACSWRSSSYPFEVTLTAVPEIPCGAGGKHEDLISLVG